MRILPLFLLAACEPNKIELDDTDPVGTDSGDTDDTGDTGDTDTGDTDDTGVPPPPPDYVVDCNGAGDFTRIQDAMDAAVSGQRIGIEPCTYEENLDFRGKYLDVYGLGDRADVIIDGTGDTVVTADHAESDGTRIATVTLTGGRASESGAAVYVSYAVLRVEDVEISGNQGYAMVYGANGFLDLVDVHIAGNSVDTAAIIADAGGLDLARTEVDCDGSDYAVYQHDASLITDSELTCRGGYALYSYHGEVNIRRSRLTGDVGLYVQDYEGSIDERVFIWNSAIGGDSVGVVVENESLEMGNSVVWGSDAAVMMSGLNPDSFVYGSVLVGGDCGISADDDAYDLRWNAFWNVGNETCGVDATDSISEDPAFLNFPDDLTLDAGSPLVDAGPTAGNWDDVDGSRNDIGVYGGPNPAEAL